MRSVVVRKRPLLLVLVAAAAGLIACGEEAPPTGATLTLLHTNDVHSRLEPITKFDSTCPADAEADACFGGWARLATAIAERRAAAQGPLMLLDAGDQFQGSLFYTYYKGQAAAAMMNALGYDAMTVGNHEFDDGPEALRDFVDAVEFPVLLANADLSQEPLLSDSLPPSIVREIGDHKFGVIGLAPPDTHETSSPGPTVAFLDPVDAVRAQVQQLEADGVDKIIVLSHIGLGADRRVAEEVAGVDVIVGGHSHTLLSNTAPDAAGPYPIMIEGPDGSPTAIVQGYAYGKYLGELTVTFDGDGRVVEAKGEPILLDAAVAEDPEAKAQVAELAGPLNEIMQEVVGEAAAAIDGSRDACRARVCAMGVLVADAMLDRVRGQGVTIAIQNGGGVRASIDAGPITMGEVLTVLPFQNTLATFELSGADVRAALENGVGQLEQGSGRFPQVAGLRFTFEPGAAAGARVRAVEVDQEGGWAPLDDAAVYGVVTNNYLRKGGDGYSVFQQNAANAYDYGPNLEEVVADYLAAGGPYEPYVDARIEAR